MAEAFLRGGLSPQGTPLSSRCCARVRTFCLPVSLGTCLLTVLASLHWPSQESDSSQQLYKQSA